MRGIWLASLVGAVVGFVGCGSDAAAPEIAQAYVLRSVAGDPLPAVFRDGDFTTLHLLADTLFLRTDGTGYEVRLQELVDKSDGSTNRYTSENNLEYTLQDGRIEIAYECADMGSCIAPPHLAGAVTITGIVFDLSLGRVPLLFERLDPSDF
jgi:hypothetical protein